VLVRTFAGAGVFGLALALSLAGCASDLGECDIEAARGPIYYDEGGFPAYGGQALVEVSCGQGRYCHSSPNIDPITGRDSVDRFGAPAALNLDIGVALTETLPDGTTTDGLDRLEYARRVAWHFRSGILTQVDQRLMPPGGEAGAISLAGAPVYRTRDGTALPSLANPAEFAAAREMLRNWLVCGAHVVEGIEGTSTGIGDIVPLGQPTSSCAEGLQDCGAGCISVDDPLHCGGCGIACGSGQVCTAGACECVSALLDACGSECVDLTSSQTHCGDCTTACPMFCADSACADTCPSGTTSCGGSCVVFATNPANCGGCGVTCGAGETCTAGSCGCSAGFENCSGTCVDVLTNPTHCGGCGAPCASGETCSGGTCSCAAGTEMCGGACVDTTRDPANCGECGTSCGGGSCVASACVSCGDPVSFRTDVMGGVFQRAARCTESGCHSGARPAANIDLFGTDYTRLWAEMVGVPATCGPLPLVEPGDPAGSYLMSKLTDVGICSGTPMPKRGDLLSTAEIDIVRRWICQGALDN
jgi:hypothetical protein